MVEESITTGRMVFVVGEYLVPIGFLITMVVLMCMKIIDKAFILMLVGFVLGSIWEWAHYFIPGFIRVSEDIDRFIPGPVYPILHSLHDSLLFTIGYGLCYLIFNKNPFGTVQNAVGSLLVMFTFFIIVEIIVEIVFNRNIWTYRTDSTNPELFSFETNIMGKKRKHVVNSWPVYEWILATFIFWSVCIYIE